MSDGSTAAEVQRVPFGRTGLYVSRLGIGAAQIGFAGTPQGSVEALLDVASDAAINVIDTAAMYGDSEEKLGRALHDRRERFLIFTKCGLCTPRRRGIRRVIGKVRRTFHHLVGDPPLEWQPDILAWNIEESLRSLKTDRLDLLQIHSCSESILRLGDVIEVLERARRAGKVRYIGYSGDGAPLNWAIASGRFDAVQLSVNVADQSSLRVIPNALQRGLGIIAKRPVANALWQHAAMPEDVTKHVYWKRLRELDYDFFKTNTAVATALKFTLSTGVHTAIVGTTRPEHLRANVETLAARISPADFTAIRSRWERIATAEWVAQM